MANAINSLTKEQAVLALSMSRVSIEDQKSILIKAGLITEEEAETLAINEDTAATLANTVAKKQNLNILNVLKVMWEKFTAVVKANANIIAITAIAATIYGVIKLHDALTVSLEEQKEKLQETKAAYVDVKSKLQELEAEIHNTNDAIKELEQKENLTWVEQEELERLREVTRELELQKQLRESEQLNAAEDLYKENENTFDKEFLSSYGSTSVSDLKQQLSSGIIGIGQLELTSNVTDIVAALQYLNEEKKNLTDENEITEYNSYIEDLTDSLKLNGQEYLTSLSEYKQNILEIASVRELTDEEQEFYDYLSSIQKMIYEFYSPATWNSLEFDSVFDTEGLEKTKEELIGLYKAGELSPKILESFPKLSEVIRESEIIAGEGSGVFKEFYNEIAALADKTSDSIVNKTHILPISSTIEQLNTQLKPAMDSLKSAYQDIFTDNGFALDEIDIISTCDSIKSKLDEMSKLGLDIDYSSYEDFVKVLNNSESTERDVENAFDSLATTITRAALTGAEDFDTMKAALEDLGVVNSGMIAFDALVNNKEALKEAGLDLVNASYEQLEAFTQEKLGAEDAAQGIASLLYNQILISDNPLDTITSIQMLTSLGGKAAETGSALIEFAQILAEINAIQAQMSENPDGLGGTMSFAIGKARLTVLQKRADALSNNIKEGIKTETDYKGSGSVSSKSAKETQKETDALSDLNSQIDKLQSAYKTLCDVRDTYNEYGKITVDQYQQLADMGFGFLSNLIDENDQLGLNATAFEKLANAKLQEMQIQLARNAVDTINGIKTEAEAVEYLTFANENLRDSALSATEALLYEAQQAAWKRGEQQGLAADQIVKGYEASKMLVGRVEFGFDTSSVEKAAGDAKETILDAYNEQKKILDHMKAMGGITNAEYNERLMQLASDYFNGNAEYRDNLWEAQEQYHDYLESIKKTYNWIENLLSSLSKKTHALIDKAEKFISWQKKNSMINRAIKAGDKEIIQNQNAYQIYMAKANSVGLSDSYKKKIQEGTLSIEDLSNEALSGRIGKYQEWYDKARDVLDTINDLYDQQRDLIRQKLDNVLDYYNDLDSYLSSVTSRFESLISLNDEMGKRSSLTDLIEQFASLSDRLESVTNSSTDIITDVTESEGSSGSPKNASEEMERDRQDRVDSIQSEIDSIRSKLEDTVTYKNLVRNIETTESALADYDATGYDNLTKKQKKTYDKLKAQLEDYYDQKAALDKNATAANVAEYNKIYLAWKALQDKLDSGKNLSNGQWKKYNNYTRQLESFADDKANLIKTLNDSLEEALNPGDKLEQIERTYEESAGELYKSYQDQIDAINGDVTNSAQYKDLLAKAQKLEQKKATKGLTKTEQAALDKYNAELGALRTGGMGSNVSEYMKTWEAWYKLQQKLDKNGKLSDKDAKKYDEYKAKLDAWNSEKQTQIDDLLSLMEDDLEQLRKTYTENVSEAESEINDYYANLYSLAKQIAEYNISSLKTELSLLESSISYCKELLLLYDSFSGDKLAKILTDLGEADADGVIAGQLDIYEKYLASLQEKYDKTLSEINEYDQLLEALNENDFESSMELFNKAMEGYREAGNTEMADKLQSVLDLLNERAADADNWGEYADEWRNEWEEALSSVKQELIGTASEIQEVNDALRGLSFENITNAIDELDKASGILSSIAGLIQDDWLFDDGKLSEYGRAKAALLVSQLENAQAKANEYLKLYDQIRENEDTYASDKAYQDALNEALQNYYDSLGDAASLENSLMDLMKKSSEEEINSLKDIIEARKKALRSKKDYYDYDKSIRNAQKDVDSIKAQIAALESLTGATDAAAKAKLAQLKAELKEKEDALQETKDEHTFNLQIDALDEFADSLTDALDDSTKSVEEILKEQKDIVESAKELYRTSNESVNETLDKLEGFYRGMGASIDGTDYAPDESRDELAEFIRQAEESFKNGVLVRATDAQLFKMAGQDIPNFMQDYQNFISPIVDIVQSLPDYIIERDMQPVQINNHYDSLINVEGNVDRNFAHELPKYIDDAYRLITDRLYRELNVLK